MENKHLKPLLDYLKIFDELYENVGPDERALTWGYHNVTCGELRAAIAEIERLEAEREHWRLTATAQERTIGILLDERDQARRWAAKLYQAASKAKKLIRRQGELNSSGWKEPASPPWPEWLPALTASAYRILDAATGGNE